MSNRSFRVAAARAFKWLMLLSWFSGMLVSGGCTTLARHAAGVAGLTGTEAAAWLSSKSDEQKPLVFDLRPEAEYRKGHITGAVQIELEQLPGYLHRADIGRDRRLLFACKDGRRAIDAAAQASALGFVEVRALNGGMDTWQAQRLPLQTGKGRRAGSRKPLVRMPFSLLQQVFVIFHAFVFKPTYMSLTLLLIFLLRKQRTKDMRLLLFALISFEIGELMCMSNYFAGGTVDTLEVLHQVGMAGMGVFLPWAVFTFVDERLLQFSHPTAPCLGIRFCHTCRKTADVSCGGERLFMLLTLFLILLTALPLSSPLFPMHIVGNVFGSDVATILTLDIMLVQFRLFPLVAGGLLSISLLVQLTARQKTVWWQLPFFLGVGLSTFALFRFVLYYGFRHTPVYVDFWEQATELMSICGVAFFLWIFRTQLHLFEKAARSEAR